jgi:hypothetical protein
VPSGLPLTFTYALVVLNGIIDYDLDTYS